MPIVADTRQALQLLERIQHMLREADELRPGSRISEDLSLLIGVLESPVFRGVLTIQDSLKDLKDQIHKHPSILPVDFDISVTTGELVLNVPPATPSPTPPLPPHHVADPYDSGYGYEDKIAANNLSSGVAANRPPSKLGLELIETKITTDTEVENEEETVEIEEDVVTEDLVGYTQSSIATYGYTLELQKAVEQAAQGREVIQIQLYKPDGSSLGFSVVGLKSEQRGELGIFIQEIQPNGVTARDCTHVICKRLGRTQKVLGALASGAWILTPEYVSACYKAGRLLPELTYEWTEEAELKEQKTRESCEESHFLPRYFYRAPKRCRETVSATKKGIFGNWIVTFFISDAQKETVYKALLERGGATVISLKLPVSRCNRNVAKLTHIFADETFTDKLARLRAKGIPCVSPDYIRNVLLRDLHCDVKDFSIFRYTSDQDPILKDLKKLTDNARFGSLRNPKAPTTRSSALTLLSNSIEPIVKRERIKEVVSVLPFSSQPIEKEERFRFSGSVVSSSSRPVTKRGRLKEIVPFNSPPRKKMKKISAMRKCTSGPMDRFITTTPSPSSSHYSNNHSATSSPLTKSVKLERFTLNGDEGSQDKPIVISDSDEEFVNTKRSVTKRLFYGKTKSSIVGEGCKDLPIVVDSSPEPPSIETLSEKLKAIRKSSLFNDGVSTDPPPVTDSSREQCSIDAWKALRNICSWNGDGSRGSPVVIDSVRKSSSMDASHAFSALYNGVSSSETPLSPETPSITRLKTKLKAIRLANLLGDEDQRTTRSKSAVTRKCKEDKRFVISSDNSNDCFSNKRSAALRRSVRAGISVCLDNSPIEIDIADNSSDDYSSKQFAFSQNATTFSRSISNGVKGVDEEVLDTTIVKGGKMTMKDITIGVLDAFTILLKNDESVLDKMSLSGFSYIESNEASNGCQAKETSTEAPALFTAILDACIDTEFYAMQTIDYIQSLLSNTYYPEPHIVSHVLWTFCLNGDLCVSANAFRLLDTIITTHPPNSAKMQLYYQRVLCKCKTGETPNPSSGWDNVLELIEFLYENPGISKLSKRKNTISPEIFRRNCEATLNFLVRLFEVDLCSTLKKGKDAATLPLVARLVWPNSSPGTVNASVRRLVECCLELAFTNVGHHIMIVNLCTQLLATVAECCVLADRKIAASSIGLHPSIGCALTTLARAIVLESKERVFKSECLHTFLKSLQPLSLRLKVSQFYLDSWTCTSTCNNRRLTMTDICSLYFPMVNGELKPMLTPIKPKDYVKMRTSRRDHTLQNLSPSPVKSKVENVNKRNMKGETQLHKACLRNDVEKVRSLLAVPGIDVLAPDNNGWTPLHEACNYGYFECVRELLAYHPKKPITKYFKPDSQKEYKLNVLVGGYKAITPLHDAVRNGHVEVALLLLRHGGKSLLKAKMQDGKTPLDCARTEEMVNALTSFVDKRPHSEISSQEDSSRSTTNVDTVGNKLMTVALYHLVDSYVTIHKFHELSDLVWLQNGINISAPLKKDVSVDSIRSLVEDVNTWLSLKKCLDKLPSTFCSVDDFDVSFLIRGFEMLCFMKE